MTEIAELLGLSRQRVNQMVKDDATFPPPEAELTGGRVWRTEVIQQWARDTGRLPRRLS